VGKTVKKVLWIVIPAAIVAGIMALVAMEHDPMGEYSESPSNLIVLGGLWFLLTAAVALIVRLAVIKLFRK